MMRQNIYKPMNCTPPLFFKSECMFKPPLRHEIHKDQILTCLVKMLSLTSHYNIMGYPKTYKLMSLYITSIWVYKRV